MNFSCTPIEFEVCKAIAAEFRIVAELVPGCQMEEAARDILRAARRELGGHQ